MEEPQQCYKCQRMVEPGNYCNMGNGLFCCSGDRETCSKLYSSRPLTPSEQKDAEEMHQIYTKILEHWEKVENEEIDDDEVLELYVPPKFTPHLQKIMRGMFGASYSYGKFTYKKYSRGMYRDGGRGPYPPKWVGDNAFKLWV